VIRFTKAKRRLTPPRRPQGVKKNVLDKLNAFLAAAEPEAVEILYSRLQGQSGVTYRELREAYLAGGMTREQFERWQAEYTRLVNSTLRPRWQAAAAAGARQVTEQYPHFVYEPSVSAAMGFIEQHGAELVTNLAREQRSALNAVIAHVSGYTAVTPDEAARIIRPCIGLTTAQALANARYREAVKEAYLKAHPRGSPETAERRAADAAAKYAARQHRYRAQNIARTELAYAYNAGHYGATKDAQARGYIGDCMKMWVTAYDERVCPICSRMDEEKRGMDDMFSNGKLLPPGHPSCRCAVAYEEISGTNLNPAADIPLAASPPVESDAHTESPMSQFLREDGTFDLEKAKESYRNFLQSAPGRNRMYLQQALGAVAFEQRALKAAVFGYDAVNDVIAYDPSHPIFPQCDLPVVLTHELAHRVDRFFVHSWEQPDFTAALRAARASFDENPQLFVEYCEKNDKEGFMSDILSAICEDDYRLKFSHEKGYWKKAGNKERETFANLFSLEAYGDEEKLRFLDTHFKGLMDSYRNLDFEVGKIKCMS